MTEHVFPSALDKITNKQLSIGELIDAATTLCRIGQPPLARQLYKSWIEANPAAAAALGVAAYERYRRHFSREAGSEALGRILAPAARG